MYKLDNKLPFSTIASIWEADYDAKYISTSRITLGILCAKVGSIQVQPIAYSVIHIRTRLELRKKDMTERRSTLLIYC